MELSGDIKFFYTNVRIPQLGFATIDSMYDARYAPDPTFTSAEIVAQFKAYVATLDQSYWDVFTKATCEDQDTYSQHQSICDKLP